MKFKEWSVYSQVGFKIGLIFGVLVVISSLVWVLNPNITCTLGFSGPRGCTSFQEFLMITFIIFFLPVVFVVMAIGGIITPLSKALSLFSEPAGTVLFFVFLYPLIIIYMAFIGALVGKIVRWVVPKKK